MVGGGLQMRFEEATHSRRIYNYVVEIEVCVSVHPETD